MNILITNDDGYQAKGIHTLVNLMQKYGKVTVIAPKHHQSGMSMAVSLGLKAIAYKKISDTDKVSWSYLDATPTSCVKFGFNTIFSEIKPDVVISGINHGSNTATASCYSGTLGAAMEGAVNGVPSIAVSLDTLDPNADFSVVEALFPEIFEKLMGLNTYDNNNNSTNNNNSNRETKAAMTYNINFPNIPLSQIKGIRVGCMGQGRWVKEFTPWNPKAYAKFGITPELLGQTSTPTQEDGEELYAMVGSFESAANNSCTADHLLNLDGYVSIVAHKIDNTDYDEALRLKSIFPDD